LSAGADAHCGFALLASRLASSYNGTERRKAMATSPDLPPPITSDPPDVPELPVEPDEGPAKQPEPSDPEKPFSTQPK
jgi:hypothetical protein